MSLQIDDDWKKQAQEEKRKLAEAEAAKKAAASSAPAAGGMGGGVGASAGGGRRAQAREVPQASFGTMVQTMMTQALYYLGELGSSRGGGSSMDLDMAKMQIDLLGLLEEKTKGNLTAEEQGLLDSALYETRMRFVAVAREVITI